jgi:hypothetical protein
MIAGQQPMPGPYHHENSVYAAVPDIRNNQLHQPVLAQMHVHVRRGREVQAGKLSEIHFGAAGGIAVSWVGNGCVCGR